MPFELDATWSRYGALILAGSPLRLFRTTTAGTLVAEALERGEPVSPSGLVDRLLDAGAIHPHPDDADARCFGLDDVTVVTPRFRRAPSGSRGGSSGGSASDDRVDEVRIADGRIVVDDASTPPIPGAAIRLDTNVGPAAARNAARPLVTTPLVAFLDDDVTVPDRHWFAGLLWHFDDPDVGLVAPRVTGEPGSPLDLGARPARIRAGTRVSYVPGAALIVRVEALDAIGWFDEGLRFGEDVDLVWRLDDAGWRCRFDPSVAVAHAPRANWRARMRQHAGYGTSAAPLALRHPGALSPLRSNGWTAAAWLAWLTGHALVATTIAVGSAAALERKVPELPRAVSFRLAMRGHLMAGREVASATRRVWWPLVAIGALVSRRCRLIAIGAILADVRSTPTDVAYGWGVWRGMWRHRTAAPIVPRLNAWPGRRPAPTHSRPARRAATRPAPGGDAR